MRLVVWTALAGLAALTAGCGTLVRGTEQTVAITSEPPGAEVVLSDGQRCTTPCQLTAARDTLLDARISRASCQRAIARLVPRVADATLWFTVLDYQLGGAYDLEPNPLAVAIDCGDPRRLQDQVKGLSGEDQALLEGFGRVGADEPPLGPFPAVGPGAAAPGTGLAPVRPRKWLPGGGR